jgi:hypothetical protein
MARTPKSKRKRAPKTILKLPNLEQSKSAVLNSLTSPSSQRSSTMRFASSLTGIARSHGWLSTKPSSPDIEFRWSNGNTLRQQSTCAWQRYVGSPTKLQIVAS